MSCMESRTFNCGELQELIVDSDYDEAPVSEHYAVLRRLENVRRLTYDSVYMENWLVFNSLKRANTFECV